MKQGSFTEGFGDPAGHGWVGHVLAETPTHPALVAASNHGVRGFTCADVADRATAVLDRLARADVDHRVILCAGANDALDTRPGGSIRSGEALQNFQVLLDQMVADRIPTLVVGSPPLVGLGQEVDASLAAFTSDLAAVCETLTIVFIETADRLRRDDRWIRDVVDGAHPGSVGYRLLADIVLAGGWYTWLDQTEA